MAPDLGGDVLGFHRMTQAGKAKVVAIELSAHGVSHTDARGRSTSRFDVVLDVYPEGGAQPFRAETHQQFSPLRFPDPGEDLAVRCNPEKQAVEIDLSNDARYNPKIFRAENDRQRQEEHDRILEAPPGTPPAGDSPSGGGSGVRKFGDDGELLG